MAKILVLIIGIFLVSSVSAACSSEYVCSEWGECNEGFSSRVCEDAKCDRKDITERRLCGENEGCSPELRCSPWSECIYSDRIENFLKGEIKFGGYQTRTCSDITGCLEKFIEEDTCSDIVDLSTTRTNECGSEVLVVSDPKSGKVFAKIDVDSWKDKKLDVVFSEKENKCSTCFNGIKEPSEDGVDCGGVCGECVEEKEFPNEIVSLSSWVLFGIISAVFLSELWRRDE